MRLRLASYADCPIACNRLILHKPWRTSKFNGKTQGAILTVRLGRRMWNAWWEA